MILGYTDFKNIDMNEQEKPFQWAEPEVPEKVAESTEDDGLTFTSVAELLEYESDIEIKRLEEMIKERTTEQSTSVDK